MPGSLYGFCISVFLSLSVFLHFFSSFSFLLLVLSSFVLFVFLSYCLITFLSVCLFFFLTFPLFILTSSHYFDQMSEGSQALKFLKWLSVSESVTKGM